jgi:hypothetical protein
MWTPSLTPPFIVAAIGNLFGDLSIPHDRSAIDI